MRIKAFIFDLHNTLTHWTRRLPDIIRRAAMSCGIDLSDREDSELMHAVAVGDRWVAEFQEANDVDIHWGNDPDDWTECMGVVMTELGHPDLDRELLRRIQRAFRAEITAPDYEVACDDALPVLRGLRDMGFYLAICTRRTIDPTPLLQRTGIGDVVDTVYWTNVVGYAKPSPYTLILAAADLGCNPMACAYVGNNIEADVGAARRAGMQPVLTTWAEPDLRGVEIEGVTVIDRLTELLDIAASQRADRG